MKIRNSIMGLGVLTFALGCASPTSKREPQQSGNIGTKVDLPNPLNKLKLYRTYFQMELETKTADQISVWYEAADGDGWDVFNLALNGNEILASIPEDRRLSSTMAFAGWPQPPKNPKATPAYMNPAIQNIVKLIPATFPDKKIKNVVIDYMGRGARINVYEYIRMGTEKPNYMPGSTSEKHYLVDTKKGTMTPFGGASGGGSAMYPLEGKLPSSWINMTLPNQFEGNPVLALNFYQEPGEMPSCLQTPLKNQNKRLLAAFARRTAEMETKSGLTSNQILAQVLSKQESTVLPQNIKQSISLYMSVYGRSTDGMGNEVDSQPRMDFPVSETPSTVKFVDPKSGILFQGTLDLTNRTIAITASKDGQTVQGLTKIENLDILRDGNQFMVESGMNAEDRFELSLPGSGKVSTFDIYSGRLDSSTFVKPINAGSCN